MKKCVVWMMVALLLTGCAAEPVYENIGDVWANSEPVGSPGTIEFSLPDGAQMEVLEDSDSKCYTVGEWEIWTQVYPGGDVRSTMEQETGIGGDALTIIERQTQEMSLYETAWSTTGEDGMKVGRTAVLDDGTYHYCVSVMVPETDAGEAGEFYNQILDSVTVSDIAP